MTIKQILPGILIVLGLASTFLVGPHTSSAHAEMIAQAGSSGRAHWEIIRQADSPGGLAVRSKPNGEIVAYLPVGSKVVIVGQANNAWIQLSAPIAGGWVAASYLGSRSPEALVIGVDNPEQCLRVRNGPGTNYEKIGCLPKGGKLKLTGTVQKEWVQIVEPMAGWVTSQQIRAPGLFPAKSATSGTSRRGSSEVKVQNFGVTVPEFSEQPVLFSGQPLDPSGAGQLLNFFQQNIQSSQSGLNDNKPGGVVGQNAQQLPAQNTPITTKTTPEVPITTTEVRPVKITNADGSTTTKEDIVTTTKSKSSDGSNITVTKDSFAGVTATKTVFPDGRSSFVTVGPDGSHGVLETSADGKSTLSRSFDANGHLTTIQTQDFRTGDFKATFFGPDGRPTLVSTKDGKTGKETTVNCDAPGKCPDFTNSTTLPNLKTGGAAAQAFKNKAVAVDPKKLLSVPGTNQLKDKAKLQSTKVGAKNIQAEVLGQIEGKPVGNLTGTKTKLKTGMLEQFKKPGETVGLNPQPLPPKDTSVKVLKEKLKVGTGNQKLQTNLTHGRTEKLNVMPFSQSVGKNFQFQSGMASKPKVQTQAVQPFKANTNVKNWGSTAGASGAFRRLHH
jgi:Bacterial SH3 domain